MKKHAALEPGERFLKRRGEIFLSCLYSIRHISKMIFFWVGTWEFPMLSGEIIEFPDLFGFLNPFC